MLHQALNFGVTTLVDAGKLLRQYVETGMWLPVAIKGTRIELMKTYDNISTLKDETIRLTEEELLAEQRKLEVLRKQNEQNQLALTIMSNKNRMPVRGMEDTGVGVELLPAPSIDLSQYLEAIDIQKQSITEVADLDMANWYLRSDVAEETFGNMAQTMMNFYQLTGEASKGAFAVFKGFAIAETLAATYAASMKIFDAYAIVPWYAYVQAGAVIALGLTRAAQIASLQPGSTGGGGGGRSAPSMPGGGNVTNNNNNQRANYNITINTQGGFEGDKDKLAREIIYYIDKARNDGG